MPVTLLGKSWPGVDAGVNVNVGVRTDVVVLVGLTVRVGVSVNVGGRVRVVVAVSCVWTAEGRITGVELAIFTYVGVEIGVANQSGAEPVLIAIRTNPIAKSSGRISMKLSDFFIGKNYTLHFKVHWCDKSPFDLSI